MQLILDLDKKVFFSHLLFRRKGRPCRSQIVTPASTRKVFARTLARYICPISLRKAKRLGRYIPWSPMWCTRCLCRQTSWCGFGRRFKKPVLCANCRPRIWKAGGIISQAGRLCHRRLAAARKRSCRLQSMIVYDNSISSTTIAIR